MKLLNLFKRSAYLPFPEIDMRPLQKTCVVYGASEPMFSGEYTIQQLGDDLSTVPPIGPHYKHRKFWLWNKRKGWVWGNKLKNATPYSSLDLKSSDAVARFSQRCRLQPSTQCTAFFKIKTQSVVVDLDAWEFYVKKPPPSVSYELVFGFESKVERDNAHFVKREDQILDNLLK